MYAIYYADMRIIHPEKKTRPVIVIGEYGKRVKVLQVTCRAKQGDYHTPLNNYKVYGNVQCSRYYWIDKKYLKSYVRQCTLSEENAINEKMKIYLK